jgi:molecular chaperone IbpA
MTNQLTLRSLDIPSIHKFAVGFDNMFDELMRTSQANTNYPPYNVVKYSEDVFSIELAVAGFKDGEVTITTERNQLTVKGEQNPELYEREYLHRGISSRSFVRTWTLADHVEVVGANSENGILTISLERKVPEEQKPKAIAITYTK